jgi:hypothetical protein
MAITAGSTSTSRRHRVEELHGVVLPSVLQDVLRWALLDDRPLVEHEQPVRDGSRTEQVVVMRCSPGPRSLGSRASRAGRAGTPARSDTSSIEAGSSPPSGWREQEVLAQPCYPVTVNDLVMVALELSPT